MNKTQKPVEPLSKKAKTHKPPNEVKTFEDFKEFYGKVYDFGIEDVNKIDRIGVLAAPQHWKTPAAKANIVKFLNATVPDWFLSHQTCERLRGERLHEASVEPYINDILKPIVTLTPLHLKTVFLEGERTFENVAAAAVGVIHDSPRPSVELTTEQASSDQETAVSLQPFVEEEGAEIVGINLTANLSDSYELARIYFAMEHHLKKIDYLPESTSRGGKVEFALIDDDNILKAVIETKLTNPNSGVYQCAAYLVMSVR